MESMNGTAAVLGFITVKLLAEGEPDEIILDVQPTDDIIRSVKAVISNLGGRWRSSGLKVTLGEEKVEVGTTFEELGIEDEASITATCDDIPNLLSNPHCRPEEELCGQKDWIVQNQGGEDQLVVRSTEPHLRCPETPQEYAATSCFDTAESWGAIVQNLHLMAQGMEFLNSEPLMCLQGCFAASDSPSAQDHLPHGEYEITTQLPGRPTLVKHGTVSNNTWVEDRMVVRLPSGFNWRMFGIAVSFRCVRAKMTAFSVHFIEEAEPGEGVFEFAPQALSMFQGALPRLPQS